MSRIFRRRAVSLIELLVAIAIIAILLGLLLSAIQQTRRTAQRVKNLNNLRQISLATHNLAGTNGDRLPFVVNPDGKGNYSSLFELILPHIEQGSVYREVLKSDKVFWVQCS